MAVRPSSSPRLRLLGKPMNTPMHSTRNTKHACILQQWHTLGSSYMVIGYMVFSNIWSIFRWSQHGPYIWNWVYPNLSQISEKYMHAILQFYLISLTQIRPKDRPKAKTNFWEDRKPRKPKRARTVPTIMTTRAAIYSAFRTRDRNFDYWLDHQLINHQSVKMFDWSMFG